MEAWNWFWLGALWNEIGLGEDEVSASSAAECNRNYQPTARKLPIELVTEAEATCGVALSGLTAELDDEFGPQIKVRGELAGSDRAECSLEVVVTAYNDKNEVVGVATEYIDATGLKFIEPLEIYLACSKSHGRAVRVRVHCRPVRE